MSPRRLNPRLWDADWLVLQGMAAIIRDLVSSQVFARQQVLDFGCGDMPYRSLIEGRGARYLGADFDQLADVRIAADGSIPVADRSCDLVLSIQVLEHVRDLGRYFAEVRRVLKPGGKLILSTHGTWLYHPHPEDHWRWTRTGLVIEIERHGFHVTQIHPVVGPLATTSMVRLAGFSHFLRRTPLVGGVLSACLAIIMNLRGILEDSITPAEFKYDNGSVYVTLCELAP